MLGVSTFFFRLTLLCLPLRLFTGNSDLLKSMSFVYLLFFFLSVLESCPPFSETALFSVNLTLSSITPSSLFCLNSLLFCHFLRKNCHETIVDSLMIIKYNAETVYFLLPHFFLNRKLKMLLP